MPFAVRSGSRIAEYTEHHIADLRRDGTLAVLSPDRTVLRTYQRAQWTLLPRTRRGRHG